LNHWVNTAVLFLGGRGPHHHAGLAALRALAARMVASAGHVTMPMDLNETFQISGAAGGSSPSGRAAPLLLRLLAPLRAAVAVATPNHSSPGTPPYRAGGHGGVRNAALAELHFDPLWRFSVVALEADASSRGSCTRTQGLSAAEASDALLRYVQLSAVSDGGAQQRRAHAREQGVCADAGSELAALGVLSQSLDSCSSCSASPRLVRSMPGAASSNDILCMLRLYAALGAADRLEPDSSKSPRGLRRASSSSSSQGSSAAALAALAAYAQLAEPVHLPQDDLGLLQVREAEGRTDAHGTCSLAARSQEQQQQQAPAHADQQGTQEFLFLLQLARLAHTGAGT
jgi:hypothetical protein